MLMRVLAGLIALSMFSMALADDFRERWDRFRLLNECQPVDLSVGVEGDAEEFGLSEEMVATAARSRLRAASLYDQNSYPYVLVYVHIAARAFSVSLEFNKLLYDEISEQAFSATTWSTGSTGTHGSDAQYVLSSVYRHTDKFIDEYLRVNEEAC